MSVVALSSVSKKFGSTVAVEDVNLEVTAAEVVGFVGVNGAGKSTTISMLLGFISPTRGTVSLFDHVVTTQNAHLSHARIGYAAGDMELFEALTGEQYLAFVRSYGHGSQKRYDDLVERFQPQLSKKIAELSRGNKQKIALIGAFVNSPELVILDEPTSGLDPLMQQAFLQLIRNERAKGTTIFMSSHILSEVADVCTRVVLIANGKIVRDGAAADYEHTGLKRVFIVTDKQTKPPKSSKEVTSLKTDKAYQLHFVYAGEVADLHAWLASVKGLKDFTVTDHGLEDAVSDLYKKEDER